MFISTQFLQNLHFSHQFISISTDFTDHRLLFWSPFFHRVILLSQGKKFTKRVDLEYASRWRKFVGGLKKVRWNCSYKDEKCWTRSKILKVIFWENKIGNTNYVNINIWHNLPKYLCTPLPYCPTRSDGDDLVYTC